MKKHADEKKSPGGYVPFYCPWELYSPDQEGLEGVVCRARFSVRTRYAFPPARPMANLLDCLADPFRVI